jgi:hypothetical protein
LPSGSSSAWGNALATVERLPSSRGVVTRRRFPFWAQLHACWPCGRTFHGLIAPGLGFMGNVTLRTAQSAQTRTEPRVQRGMTQLCTPLDAVDQCGSGICHMSSPRPTKATCSIECHAGRRPGRKGLVPRVDLSSSAL